MYNRKTVFQPRTRVNTMIYAKEVQVIGAKGEQLGSMDSQEALKMARESDLDLVEVSPNAKPPIVKIMDYGKYVYEKERKEKAHKISSKSHEVKMVRVGFRTESHDLQVKIAQISKFLEKGFRVKIDMRLRGREKGMVDIARQKMESFLNMIPANHVIETPVKRFPNAISVQIRGK